MAQKDCAGSVQEDVRVPIIWHHLALVKQTYSPDELTITRGRPCGCAEGSAAALTSAELALDGTFRAYIVDLITRACIIWGFWTAKSVL
jgi:hypothetical protein